ncbi:MAG: type IV pilus twitching motility protein PilT [Deltaproteobacteria bacterium]|nr:type IV pilus twitching motility protein PilT [Deltaproteobacteria bacterium]
MEINDILKIAIQGGASDIHLKAGMPPIFRIDGNLLPLKDAPRLPPEEVSRLAFSIMNDYQRQKFQQENDIDFAYGVPGLGRFRVNVFSQRGAVGMVMRVIPFKILPFESLNLPKVLEKIALNERGLILVTGTTGSGKSTTLASMVDYINTNRTCHIVTIEDPIEFLIRDKRSIINQREVGSDTVSFGVAMRAVLRQDPDVIMVGEMRDLETIETALTAAETGHLVLSTLHTLDATESINRIVGSFPPHQQKQVRLQLASVLRAVISQRLVPRADGRGRVPAVEIMINTAFIRELIEDKDRTKEIPEVIAKSHLSWGMQTFDQSLMFLYKNKLITYEEALRQATNRDDFALRVQGVSSTDDTKWSDFEKETLNTSSPAEYDIPTPFTPKKGKF